MSLVDNSIVDVEFPSSSFLEVAVVVVMVFTEFIVLEIAALKGASSSDKTSTDCATTIRTSYNSYFAAL